MATIPFLSDMQYPVLSLFALGYCSSSLFLMEWFICQYTCLRCFWILALPREFLQYVRRRKSGRFEERLRKSEEMSRLLRLQVPELVSIGENLLKINIRCVTNVMCLLSHTKNSTNNRLNLETAFAFMPVSNRWIGCISKPRIARVSPLPHRREMEEQFRSICRTEVERKQRDGEVTFVLWSAFLFCGSLLSLLLLVSILIHLVVYTIPLNLRGKPLISWGMEAFTALQWKYPSVMMIFVNLRFYLSTLDWLICLVYSTMRSFSPSCFGTWFLLSRTARHTVKCLYDQQLGSSTHCASEFALSHLAVSRCLRFYCSANADSAVRKWPLHLNDDEICYIGVRLLVFHRNFNNRDADSLFL